MGFTMSYLYNFCSKNATILDQFHLQIAQHELYPKESALVDQLLHLMITEPILHVGKYKIVKLSFAIEFDKE